MRLGESSSFFTIFDMSICISCLANKDICTRLQGCTIRRLSRKWLGQTNGTQCQINLLHDRRPRATTSQARNIRFPNTSHQHRQHGRYLNRRRHDHRSRRLIGRRTRHVLLRPVQGGMYPFEQAAGVQIGAEAYQCQCRLSWCLPESHDCVWIARGDGYVDCWSAWWTHWEAE